MFSPCSLRSTQCAALIALAAAAGISRFETDDTAAARNSEAGSPTARVPSVPAHALLGSGGFRFSSVASIRWFQSAASTLIAFFAPPHAVASATDDSSDTGPQGSPMPAALLATDSSAALPPPALTGRVVYFSAPLSAPRERDHAWPYAVGPPRRGTNHQNLLRVAGTAVPCDSAPRRMSALFLPRIARASLSVSSAPLTRLADSGPSSTESIFPPSSALRGEPASPLSRFSRRGFAMLAPHRATAPRACTFSHSLT